MDSLQEKLEFIESYIINCNISSKEVLTFEEAAIYIGFSKSALYKMTSKKEIPFYVPGGKKIFFRRTEIEEWVFNARVSPVIDFEREIENYIGNSIKNQMS